MSAPASGNPHWQAHLARLERLYGSRPSRAAVVRPGRAWGPGKAEAARSSEWTAAPPGRLGRRLLDDIEPYLEFFALARG